jgi:cytochrome P450
LDGEPAATKLKLVRQLMADCPREFFEELRAKRPVLVMPECTLVALYDDVIEVLSMPKIFTVALYGPKMSNGYLMMRDDDAVHYREKSIMQGLLNRDDLPQVRRMVSDISSSILAKARGRLDAVGQYCRMVPATIVRD